MKWIPVLFNLPPERERVLIYIESEDPTVGGIELGFYQRSADGTGYWYSYPNDGDGRWSVSHWMSLQPPTEEDAPVK